MVFFIRSNIRSYKIRIYVRTFGKTRYVRIYDRIYVRMVFFIRSNIRSYRIRICVRTSGKTRYIRIYVRIYVRMVFFIRSNIWSYKIRIYGLFRVSNTLFIPSRSYALSGLERSNFFCFLFSFKNFLLLLRQIDFFFHKF